MEILRRAWAIQNRELTRRQLEEVDVVIRPQVQGFGIADLLKMDVLVERGKSAGEAALSSIERANADWQARMRRRRQRFRL